MKKITAQTLLLAFAIAMSLTTYAETQKAESANPPSAKRVDYNAELLSTKEIYNLYKKHLTQGEEESAMFVCALMKDGTAEIELLCDVNVKNATATCAQGSLVLCKQQAEQNKMHYTLNYIYDGHTFSLQGQDYMGDEKCSRVLIQVGFTDGTVLIFAKLYRNAPMLELVRNPASSKSTQNAHSYEQKIIPFGE